MKNILLFALVISFNSFADETPLTNVTSTEEILIRVERTQAPDKHFSFGVKSEVYYGRLDKDLGANLSNAFANFNSQGDAGLLDVLKGSESIRDLNFEISAKFSALPYILEGSTRDKLREEVDAVLPGIIDSAMSQNPLFETIPSEMYQGIKSDLINSAKIQQYDRIDKRIKRIQKETRIQEFTFSTCGDFCISLGKEKVFSTFNESGETGVLISPDRVKTSGGTVGTGFVKFSHDTELMGVKTVIDVLVFKSRPSFHQAPEYIGKIINLNNEDFDRTDKVYNIDSQAIKMTFVGEKTIGSIFVAHHNKSSGVEVTGSLEREIGQNGILSASGYFNFDESNRVRTGIQKGVSLEYTHALTDKFSAAARASHYWSQDNPYTSALEKEDGSQFSLGMKYDIYRTERVGITAKYERTFNLNSPIHGNKSDDFFGVSFEVKF